MAGNTCGPDRTNWTIEKIEARGTPDGDCILYTGNSLHRQGYPMMRAFGKMRTISSVIAQLKYGKAPNRESRDKVTRTCGNIKCIKAKHTIIQTKGEIMKNAHQTGFTTLLNADQVRAIRKEYDALILVDKNGNVRRRQNGNTLHKSGSQQDLAEKYGVNSRMIWNVVRGRLYLWVK
jgi:hypothetical protein